MGVHDGHIESRFYWRSIKRAPKSNPAEEVAWIVRRTDQLLAEEIDAGIPIERLARVLAVPTSVVQERADRHRRQQKTGGVVNISERRTLVLHRVLAERLDAAALASWTPRILANLDRLKTGVQGRPHVQNLTRWRRLVEAGDVDGIRAVLLSVEVDGIEMREVSPMGGILSEAERMAALNSIRRP
ncbi:hypothetical protein GMA12_06940 [Kocuria sediminis]|uniref:Uncharacterized protein n=1 Tax=Kocuria sediminis TaxID=1038857 RepID=A0A6N8GIY3_9MICC|nr:hypothetical protein [Kocuria sediminis]MUN62878.1 hypothetical protein [Kocuria sediminis]